MKTAKQLIDILEQSKKQGTTPYDTQAEVVRVDGDTLWCHFLGGIDETPVEKTINADIGDTVQVRVSGGRAWVTGNQTAPPTDDKEVKRVERKVETSVAEIQAVTNNLQEQIDNLDISGDENQYFWHVESGSDTGSHITEIPKDDFQANPRGFNVLIRSIGFAIRNALTELAQFTSSLIRLGNPNDTHAELSTDGFKIFSEINDNMEEVVSLGYGDVIGPDGSVQTGTYYSFGMRDPSQNKGDWSIAEGVTPTASGYGSHAEGYMPTASGNYSHAEGGTPTASGDGSHAEGENTTASGDASHSEGLNTQAKGQSSHAQNHGTIATGDSQTAMGRYNVEDTEEKYALIIGNGTPTARKNIFTVDWDGEVADGSGNALVHQASANTSDTMFYSSDTNKLAVSIINKVANNRLFRLMCRDKYLYFYDSTSSKAMWRIYPNGVYLQAVANASQTNLASGTITKVSLKSDLAGPGNNDYLASAQLSVASGCIKVAEAGRYRISASAYIEAVSGQTARGVYVYIGTGTTVATMTETMSCLLAGSQSGAISIAPKIVELPAGANILLAGRSMGAASKLDQNLGTYLLVERLS